MTTHEIIAAKETPMGVILKIKWDEAGDANEQIYCEQAAKALGWKRPDPQPVDPAWMVEVAREAVSEGGMTGTEIATCVLRLALSRGHVALAPVMPSKEEMLRDAREDAAQAADERDPRWASVIRSGNDDESYGVQCALQARRNVYASLGAVARPAVSSGPVVPEAALTRAWDEDRLKSPARAALQKEEAGRE